MSRWSLDPPDDDAYDERPDATCDDCGIDFFGRAELGGICDACCNARDAWVDRLELRMLKADLTRLNPARYGSPVVDVAIVPLDPWAPIGPVVEVGLVPIANSQHADARDLKRMATAILSADLSTIKEVA